MLLLFDCTGVTNIDCTCIQLMHFAVRLYIILSLHCRIHLHMQGRAPRAAVSVAANALDPSLPPAAADAGAAPVLTSVAAMVAGPSSPAASPSRAFSIVTPQASEQQQRLLVRSSGAAGTAAGKASAGHGSSVRASSSRCGKAAAFIVGAAAAAGVAVCEGVGNTGGDAAMLSPSLLPSSWNQPYPPMLS